MCLDYSVAGAVVSRLTPYAGKDVRLDNSPIDTGDCLDTIDARKCNA